MPPTHRSSPGRDFLREMTDRFSGAVDPAVLAQMLALVKAEICLDDDAKQAPAQQKEDPDNPDDRSGSSSAASHLN